jgi:pyridoxal phosphate phosphatase PHOSPHO2
MWIVSTITDTILFTPFPQPYSQNNMTVQLSADPRVDVDADSWREGAAATSTPSSSRSPPPLTPVDTLFVWDFDWTIVDCNSDEYVPAQFLGSKETERRLRRYVGMRGPTGWHECVSDLVNECADECGLSPCDVHAAAARMPHLADVRGAIDDVRGRASCGQAIISDGNDYFIGAFLGANKMEGHFTHGVETNAGRWESRGRTDGASTARDGRRFVVVHQSSKYGGHNNAMCPPNLCKTQVLLDVLSRTAGMTTRGRRPRVVYVGDGSNDACPALNVLDERDVLLARAGRMTRDPNSRSGGQPDEGGAGAPTGDDFGILKAIERRTRGGGGTPRCRVCSWNSGRQLRSLVGDILNEEVTT